MKIKQLLEENKNIRDNSNNYKNNYNKKNMEKLFLNFIETFLNKKLIEYKYQLFIKLLQYNINNISKYIIYQGKSLRSSLNLEGYEKVMTGESKKIIINENENKSEVSFKNKIIFHKDLDDTLKEYITKGKNNFMFEEIFDDEKIKNNNKNTIVVTKRNKNKNIIIDNSGNK